MRTVRFEWDAEKDRLNQEKHGVSFKQARQAFKDPNRVIVKDITHSNGEERLYCIGRISKGIVMVRFTYRDGNMRIFGAGFWRKGKEMYEKKNKIHT